ncbi:MAG: flavin monoamine oxidase family protein [Microcystaceae cyanobacterium]
MNRRTLLRLVSRAGGTAAMLTTMKAIGLLNSEATKAEYPNLPVGSGNGIKIAILGAGIAGMTAAYELSKAGYQCTLLEARERAGGRCWTIRRGDTIRELDSQQTCQFDSDDYLYMNVGAARIPHHHRALLGYCKEFGVPLQVIVNDNRACFFHDENSFNGQPVLNRRLMNDRRGYMAELLAKSVSQNALDQPLQPEEQERLLAMIRRFGDLNPDLQYKGSSRSGYAQVPDVESEGEIIEPLPFSEVLKSDFWRYKMDFSETHKQAPTLLEPIGGMDQIAKAFEKKVGHLIRYNAEVTQLRKTEKGVQILYKDKKREIKEKLEADFAICTLPLPVLASLDTDFSPSHQAAIAVGAKSYIRAIKHGFQAKRRFWEEDAAIYGGISWTSQDITQIWYPSHGFHQPTGIIVGAYIWSNSISDRIEVLPIAQRLQRAITEGTAIHPTYTEDIQPETGMSIAWGKIPYSLGGWLSWDEKERQTAYPVLNQPDGRIYLAGEHLSYLTGWQEGAILSAHKVVKAINSAPLI